MHVPGYTLFSHFFAGSAVIQGTSDAINVVIVAKKNLYNLHKHYHCKSLAYMFMSSHFLPVKCNIIMQITRKRVKKVNAASTLEGRIINNVEKNQVSRHNHLKWNTNVQYLHKG